LPNIAEKVKDLPQNPPRQRVISEDEYRKILAVCEPDEKAIITFLANTGLRVQELCDLSPSCVSPDRCYMTILGKGKRRSVPLNETARNCLDIVLSKSYKRDHLYYMCKILSRRAAIIRFGPHSLRHRFCTALLKKNVPIAIVSKIMGHSSPIVTMKVYCHILLPDTLGATDCLDG